MAQRRRRIALYGGTFDPVHAGHLAVARSLLDLFALDEVLFVPAYVAPHKRERRVSPSLERYAMLVLATQGEERFRVSTVELQAPERPYTVNTLSSFCESMSDAQLFFVMGADSWEEITTWREWERVLTLTDQLVVTRPGYELKTGHVNDAIRGRVVDARGWTREQVAHALEEEGHGTRIYLTDAVNVRVAATDIRAVVGRGGWDELSALVAPPVAEYIRKYKLYQSEHGTEFSNAGIKRTH
ncbi:MAG TPA: nicotinate-nucleotide adenylyltransferase [Pyrinomonadaceae bacterium]|nr:nicotinate-nucleotide adenylyltransferase [Pyrinomonadaceae bacterium]